MFTAVAAIGGERAEDAATSSSRTCVTWLKTDEHALAGGLASKLSEAEGRAIKLLTPPKPPADAASSRPPRHPAARPGRQVGTDRKDRLTAKDWSTTAEELLQQAGGEPPLPAHVQWTIEEEPQ